MTKDYAQGFAQGQREMRERAALAVMKTHDYSMCCRNAVLALPLTPAPAPEPPKCGTWLPIATAPKDVAVLGFHANSGEMRVCRSHHESDDTFVFWYTKQGASVVWWPTHWMLLPAPPQEPV